MGRFGHVLTIAALGGALIAPNTAHGYTFDPPSWFDDGVVLIEKRGGKCEPFKFTRVDPPGPFPPGVSPPQQTTVEEGTDCNHLIPRKVANEFGQNPARGEVCSGIAKDVTGTSVGVTPEQYAYGCRIFVSPGTSGKPNRKSWPCARTVSGGDNEPTRNQRRWTAERTKIYRKQTFRTLKQCLDRRLRDRR